MAIRRPKDPFILCVVATIIVAVVFAQTVNTVESRIGHPLPEWMYAVTVLAICVSMNLDYARWQINQEEQRKRK